ncbi:MAG: hypothetical protein MPN21_07485 [Thermoanaerobaculia bacterium]|nr:hypothetical protein [Thermoanaerobaculia bacterium]
MRRASPLLALIGTLVLVALAAAQQGKIYWGDEVPQHWNGDWPASVLTVPERTDYTRTTGPLELLEYIDAIRWQTENVHVVQLFRSPLGNIATAVVMANPRIRSAEEARASGKPIVFLMGGIHPPEPEATEAIQMVMREILLGDASHLLDHQIVVAAPLFNVDGAEAVGIQTANYGSVTPHLLGQRSNSQGLDLNRDGVKLETVEARGLYRFFNEWDPILFLDGHLMSRVTHGYANAYATSTVPAAHPGPRDYVTNTLFPAVRELVRDDYGLEVFTHALFDRSTWPPTEWAHDQAGWTVEAKFVINDFGLRNRMGIITETPGQPTFERRIYAQYAYIMSLLEYTNTHATEMQEVVRHADESTVQAVLDGAEAGTLRNWVAGKYISRGKVDILAYRENVPEYLPGTSVLGTRPGTAEGKPERIRDVDDKTLPVGTKDAWMPRGYLIPREYDYIAEKLRQHGIRVSTLEQDRRVEGEQFIVASTTTGRRGLRVLDGQFAKSTTDFPAGTYFVDMAQPMANAAFYYLEPESTDGFTGWGVLDETLLELDAARKPFAYPIFKYRRDSK